MQINDCGSVVFKPAHHNHSTQWRMQNLLNWSQPQSSVGLDDFSTSACSCPHLNALCHFPSFLLLVKRATCNICVALWPLEQMFSSKYTSTTGLRLRRFNGTLGLILFDFAQSVVKPAGLPDKQLLIRDTLVDAHCKCFLWRQRCEEN